MKNEAKIRLTGLNHFFAVLKLKVVLKEGRENLVVVERGVESWEGWKEGEVEEEESND